MTNFEPGSYEFTPAKFVELIQQYDQFLIHCGGAASFMQIRVPSKWVKLEHGVAGEEFIACRNKRKRDGHLFKINGDKVTFEIADNAGGLAGRIRTDIRDDSDFYVSMWSNSNTTDDAQ